MRINKKHWKLLFIVALSFSTLGCGGSDDGIVAGSDSRMAGELLASRVVNVPEGVNASAVIQYDYAMPGVQGGLVTARSLYLRPVSAMPEGGYPLIVWAHGTTGIAESCAPSSNFPEFYSLSPINNLLDAGYAVAAPDYEGFGTGGIHPYYVRSSHAASVLNAVVALHALDDVQVTDAWAVVGNSQGGHVALAAARATQLPAYPLEAVVALAPGTDLVLISNEQFQTFDDLTAAGEVILSANRLFYLNAYAAYVAHSHSLIVDGFEPAGIFDEDIAPLIDIALDETDCGDYADRVASALQQHFIANDSTVDGFRGLKRDWYTDPLLEGVLKNAEMADEAQAAPLLIVQGEDDQQVPVTATDTFVSRQRAAGTEVTYEVIPGGGHGTPSNSAFSLALDWLAENFPAQ
jgi:pimeloyl-ACP methyl ester carboxylesterase